jgi:hypothetical protein
VQSVLDLWPCMAVAYWCFIFVLQLEARDVYSYTCTRVSLAAVGGHLQAALQGAFWQQGPNPHRPQCLPTHGMQLAMAALFGGGGLLWGRGLS